MNRFKTFLTLFPLLFFLSFPFYDGKIIIHPHESHTIKQLADKSDSKAPFGLMVEYIREPENISIKDSQPEYCWIVPGEAVTQTSYQILVASSRNNIERNIGDIWNSGQIRDNKSSGVEHQGKPLKSNNEYFWKVRIWDKNSRQSEYSGIQKFRTAYFTEGISTGNSIHIERISPKRFFQTSGNSYFADFGKDAFGTIELNYASPEPDTLIIRLGEKLDDKSIDRNPGGTIRIQEVKLPVSPEKKTYTLSLIPDKRNTTGQAVQLPDSFGVIMPFRYCEIENIKAELNPGDLRQKAYFYFFDESESSFSSSDTILNQIWDLCKYSIKATSFAGVYIDGDRERIPYEADAYINQLGHFCTDREYSLAKVTIEYFMEHPTWPTEWLLHTALMVYQDYYYTGDLEMTEHYYDILKHKTLIELSGEDGLISSFSEKITDEYMLKLGFSDPTSRLKDIVDWPPAQKDTGWKLSTPEGERDGHEMVQVNTVVNSFFYMNMVMMAELASILDNQKDRDLFLAMADKVKKAINEKLFDKTRGIYIDGEGSSHSSVHSNMLPLAFGIVPEEFLKPVVKYIKSRGLACSVYSAQYLLEGLFLAGEEQYALDLMRSTGDRSWWNMIKAGSTITLEAWDMKYKPNSDWNHAWGAVPANIIPRFLWGITPETPGFEIVKIEPRLGNLKNSKITVPTIKGQVKGTYQNVNEYIDKYMIELPANVTGKFIISAAEKQIVKVNGRTVDPVSGSISLLPGMSNIEVRSE